jgi:hypothetical protein
MRKKLKDRLFDKTFVDGNGCRVWTGSLTKKAKGYGRIKVNHALVGAHRLSWELHNGPIPTGLRVLHKCDNSPCINPDHLFLGTQLDNVRDCIKKGRFTRNPLRGESHPGSKITMAQAGLIRADSRIQRVIAAEYGISQSTVSYIKTGLKWVA